VALPIPNCINASLPIDAGQRDARRKEEEQAAIQERQRLGGCPVPGTS
jgi:hypothetical protein